MKRRKFLWHLGKHGCAVVGEGRGHTRVINLASNQQSFVPRHRETKPSLVREICRQLGIPAPLEC